MDPRAEGELTEEGTARIYRKISRAEAQAISGVAKAGERSAADEQERPLPGLFYNRGGSPRSFVTGQPEGSRCPRSYVTGTSRDLSPLREERVQAGAGKRVGTWRLLIGWGSSLTW